MVNNENFIKNGNGKLKRQMMEIGFKLCFMKESGRKKAKKINKFLIDGHLGNRYKNYDILL